MKWEDLPLPIRTDLMSWPEDRPRVEETTKGYYGAGHTDKTLLTHAAKFAEEYVAVMDRMFDLYEVQNRISKADEAAAKELADWADGSSRDYAEALAKCDAKISNSGNTAKWPGFGAQGSSYPTTWVDIHFYDAGGKGIA